MLEGIETMGQQEIDGINLLFGAGKTLPKNFFFEFEVKRLTYHSNLILNRYSMMI